MRCTGHPCEAEVASEKSLVAEPRQRFMYAGQGTAFFCLHELMQSMLPRAVAHNPASEFVNDLYFALFHQVVRIAMHEVQGRQGLTNKRLTLPAAGPEPSIALGEYRQPLLTVLGQSHRTLIVFTHKVTACRKLRSEFEGALIGLLFGHIVVAASNDQRRARLVDEDAICFVNNGIVETT